MHEEEALRALRDSDLLKLGMAADALRREKHPENVVTYVLKGSRGRSLEESLHEATVHGSAEVMLADVAGIEGISCEKLAIELRAQHKSSPKITFHQLPISVLSPANCGELSLEDGLGRLEDAGLRSIGPDPQSKGQVSSPSDLSRTLRAARTLDIGVSVALDITSSDPLQRRLDMLATLRALQEETHAIQSILVRVRHAATPEARREEEATAVDYLKTLAVTRLFMDSVEHIQTDWTVMGPKVLELALRFGADDAGTVPRSQAGPEPSHHGGESELRRIIRDAGFRPVERDALFRQSLLH